MNVLITSTTFIPSVILCGHCQMDYLEKLDELKYRFIISHFTKKEDVEWADIIIFLRSDSDIDAYISKIAKKAGKHLVYVMDDDLLNVPSYLSSAPYYSLPSTKKNIKTIMSNCNTFLTPSRVLLEKYGKLFKRSFLIDEPSLNIIDKKEKNEKLKIGFAGSIDRSEDIQKILKEAIEIIHDKYKDQVQIEFMGAKPDFVDELGLTHLPYQDGYDAYTAFMSRCNWDIGLAPMPSSEFHRCKYINKYVEYSSFGIVGIYSNVEPYIYGITDKNNGLLVENNTKDWVDAISLLIEDNGLRNKISENCLNIAKNEYSLNKLAYDYLEKIKIDYKPIDRVTIPSLEPAKAVMFVKRLYRKITEQGLSFPKWLYKKLEKKFNDWKNEKDNIRKLNDLKTFALNNNTMCVIAPFFENKTDEYSLRVKKMDDYYNNYHKIYLSGEDRLCEVPEVAKIDDNHTFVLFNSYDINQVNSILELVQNSKNCLIHSVVRFLREKISNDMFKLFDLQNVNVIWDTHGNVPEQYHEQKNYHIEMVTNEIEKVFFDKSDLIVCENDDVKDILIKKYKKEQEFLIYK